MRCAEVLCKFISFGVIVLVGADEFIANGAWNHLLHEGIEFNEGVEVIF